MGYPIRGIFKGEYLYLHNFETDRWPAGNPETGYMNCDGSPTKTEILKRRHDPVEGKYWEWAFGKRPSDELYNVVADPDCLTNLIDDPEVATIRDAMSAQLWDELRAQGDPRLTGDGGPLDENPVADSKLRNFYNRFLDGKIDVAGWINASDVEK